MHALYTHAAMMPFRLIQALVPNTIADRLTNFAFVQKGPQKVASMNAILKKRQLERQGGNVSTRIHNPTPEGKEDLRPLLDEGSAALTLQRSWRCSSLRPEEEGGRGVQTMGETPSAPPSSRASATGPWGPR